MRIRSIEAADREFFIDRCHAFYKTPACDHEIPQQNAERTFELLLHGTPYADCLIAEDENGQPCAYCLLALTWSNEAGGLCVWLEEIMVDDEQRGKGIGSRLIVDIAKCHQCGKNRRTDRDTGNQCGVFCLCNKEGVGKIVNECHNQTENDRKRHFKVGSVKMFRIKNRIHKNILSKK